MIYAQIKSGVVVNTISLTDVGLISLFSTGFDSFIRIDTLSPVPGIGWTYDGMNFSPSAGFTPDEDVEGGSGTIPSGDSTYAVIDDRVSSTSMIVVTLTTSDLGGAILQGNTPADGSFTINMTTPGSVDLDFQYIIIRN